MSDTIHDLLKQFFAELAQAFSDFSRQAEEAMIEARKAGGLSEQTKVVVDELDLRFNSLTEAEGQLKTRLGEIEQEFARVPSQTALEPRDSLGSMVIKSEALKAFASSLEGGKRLTTPVNAALSSDIPPNVVEPERLPGIDVMPKQRLFIRDLIAPGRSTAPVIFWMQQTGFTNAASVVAEGLAKPYPDIKITAVPPWRICSRRPNRSSTTSPKLQSTIDVEMRYGLKYVEEEEVLFGESNGVHLKGTVPKASVFSPAFEVAQPAGIDDLRLAMLQAQLARLPTSGHVLHLYRLGQDRADQGHLGTLHSGQSAGAGGSVCCGAYRSSPPRRMPY